MRGYRRIRRPLLIPFSLFYWIGVTVRNWLFDLHVLHSTSFQTPVISIGNITVGGTGKTPHVEMLIRMLKTDYRLAVLSRGYKRRSRGFVLATRHSGVPDIGDEPLQIKSKFPEIYVAVDSDRVHGVQKLLKIKRKPDVILLDDAFQHRYIKPGLSILLVDYHQPVFQDFLLPAGNLRESWKNSKRSDIVIVTKCPDRLLPHERSWFGDKMNLRPRQDLYFTAYSYSTPRAIFPSNKKKDDVRTFKQLRKSHAGILLMTGIANPAPILHFLEKSLVVHDKLFYADHHDFTNYDLHTISTHLQAVPGVEKYIIVTEKDAVKLRELEMDGNLKKALLYIPIEVKFLAKGEKPFYKRVEKFVRKAIH